MLFNPSFVLIASLSGCVLVALVLLLDTHQQVALLLNQERNSNINPRMRVFADFVVAGTIVEDVGAFKAQLFPSACVPRAPACPRTGDECLSIQQHTSLHMTPIKHNGFHVQDRPCRQTSEGPRTLHGQIFEAICTRQSQTTKSLCTMISRMQQETSHHALHRCPRQLPNSPR